MDGHHCNGSSEQNGTGAASPHKKREDYLEWPEYFMAVAFLSAQRSKDPSSQVGACIVSQENKIVGIGYNGMPNGCSDDLLPWSRSASDKLDTKYPYEFKTPSTALPVLILSSRKHKGKKSQKLSLASLGGRCLSKNPLGLERVQPLQRSGHGRGLVRVKLGSSI
ncbi:deoxycytidylate deaminase isoform X2 [Amia ocellicauda]|uniref:deoxycytidylate deaminase isoform X2 n=1 Tax=Amia ocellicauda TaxID=2972642 RepID=UPI003464ADAA